MVTYTVLGGSEQDAKPSMTLSQIVTYYRCISSTQLEIIMKIILLIMFFHFI